MSENELKKYIDDFNKYVVKIKASETKEQSKKILIKTGVLNDNGKINKNFQCVFK